MDIVDIAARLAELDAKQHPSHLPATLLQYRGGGGSCAWDCQVDDGTWFVVKGKNNPQEQHSQPGSGYPLKIVTTELICGRLGQLFNPPVCPEALIINIPDNLASGSLYPNNSPISAGANVGSRRVDNVFDSKSGGGAIHLVPPRQMARIVVFQTWLNGQDPAALISLDGSFALSIDHGWYFTGSQWNKGELVNITNFTPVLAQWPRDRLQDAALFREVLDELMGFSEETIMQQFVGIPTEWGTSNDFMAKLVAFILERRKNVEQAIAMLCRGAA